MNTTQTTTPGIQATPQPDSEPDLSPAQEVSSFRSQVIRMTAIYSIVALAVWWSVMRGSYPFVVFGFIVGVAGGLLRFAMHASEIKDQLSPMLQNSGGSHAGRSLFRFGIAVLAMLIAVGVGNGNLAVIFAAALGLVMPVVTMVAMTVHASRQETDPDAMDNADGNTKCS